jgi:hypothetical protein
MMHKAKEKDCDLKFSAPAEAQYLSPAAANAIGPAHDEWKLIPWGIPKAGTQSLPSYPTNLDIGA